MTEVNDNKMTTIGVEANNNSKNRTIHIQVTGMMCQRNCGTTVSNALREEFGVQAIDVGSSYEQCRAWVTYAGPQQDLLLLDANDVNDDDGDADAEDAAMMERAIDAIECVGFDAEPIEDLQAHLRQMNQTVHMKVDGTNSGFDSPLDRNQGHC